MQGAHLCCLLGLLNKVLGHDRFKYQMRHGRAKLGYMCLDAHLVLMNVITTRTTLTLELGAEVAWVPTITLYEMMIR